MSLHGILRNKLIDLPKPKSWQHFVGVGTTCAGRVEKKTTKTKKPSSKLKVQKSVEKMMREKMVRASATARPPGVERSQKFVDVIPMKRNKRNMEENEGVNKADFEEMRLSM